MQTLDNSQDLIINKIELVLSELRPLIQGDGGDIEFVSFINGVVSVRLHGACVGCPMSIYTLKLGIEEQLKLHIPEVLEVVAL